MYKFKNTYLFILIYDVLFQTLMIELFTSLFEN